MQNIISIKNIHKERQGIFSLHIEHLNVQAGELVALVGPSGCGKSTALDLMAAILRPDFALTLDQGLAQEFIFNPEGISIDILAYWKNNKQNELAKLRLKYIGYVLQTGGLLPFLSGEDNILLACHNYEHKKHIKNLAETLDISHLLHKKPLQMSVGERQRFAIARALVHGPKLVLADEPVASLDPLNAKIVLELFTKLAKEQGISVVMVSHAPDSVKNMGFRLVSTNIQREGAETISCINGNNVGGSHDY